MSRSHGRGKEDIKVIFFSLPFKGDVGLTAGLPGEDLREVRDDFHGQDRERDGEAAAFEEEEQVVERAKLPRPRQPS